MTIFTLQRYDIFSDYQSFSVKKFGLRLQPSGMDIDTHSPMQIPTMTENKKKAATKAAFFCV